MITKGKYLQRINETEIDGNSWKSIHKKTIIQNYRKSPYFDKYIDWLIEKVYEPDFNNISDFNTHTIKEICNLLGIKTKIIKMNDLNLPDDPNNKLIEICKIFDATEYVSGPSAKNYLIMDKFNKENIDVIWFDYDNYYEYPQNWGGFYHNVSIIDMIFNCGEDIKKYMRFVT